MIATARPLDALTKLQGKEDGFFIDSQRPLFRMQSLGAALELLGRDSPDDRLDAAREIGLVLQETATAALKEWDEWDMTRRALDGCPEPEG